MSLTIVSATRDLASNDAAQRLRGPHDRHLKEAQRLYEVEVRVDGLKLTLVGARAQEALGFLIDQETQALKQGDGPALVQRGPKGPATPRTDGQRALAQALEKNTLILAAGPAGTGKTRLAVDTGVAQLKARKVERIVLSRPAIEAGERLGFLPGDLKEKVDPYMRPLYDALEFHYDAKTLAALIEARVIEIAPVAFLRGRTLEHAFVVVDEAQNLTPGQFKMVLTRIGTRSIMAVLGDPEQVDLPAGTLSGFPGAITRLDGVEGVSVVRLNEQDCVRSTIVTRILAAYKNGG